MTQIWRKMQGVDTHESASDAEFLNMNFYLSYNCDFNTHEISCSCFYTIYGDTIQHKFFESPDEALDWIHDIILDEAEKNMKALQEHKNVGST